MSQGANSGRHADLSANKTDLPLSQREEVARNERLETRRKEHRASLFIVIFFHCRGRPHLSLQAL